MRKLIIEVPILNKNGIQEINVIENAHFIAARLDRDNQIFLAFETDVDDRFTKKAFVFVTEPSVLFPKKESFYPHFIAAIHSEENTHYVYFLSPTPLFLNNIPKLDH